MWKTPSNFVAQFQPTDILLAGGNWLMWKEAYLILGLCRRPRNPMAHRPMQMLHPEEVPQFVQVDVGDVEHQQFIVYADWTTLGKFQLLLTRKYCILY